MIAMTTIWNFLKTHWEGVLLLVVVGFCYAWVHKTQVSYADTISQLNASHQTEIAKMTQDRVVEEQQHAQELQTLQAADAKIQADYAAAQQQLSQQQTQEQTAIVKQYGNDAQGMANLLASKMGFTVVK